MPQKPETNEKYLMQYEVADFLDVTVRTIQNWERKGIFPQRVKPEGVFGPYAFYLREEIERYKNHQYAK